MELMPRRQSPSPRSLITVCLSPTCFSSPFSFQKFLLILQILLILITFPLKDSGMLKTGLLRQRSNLTPEFEMR